NDYPRYDTSGNIVDAHDGGIVQFGGTYYLYGTRYGNTNGVTEANYFRCYSSTDLTTWKLETDGLLQSPPAGMYYRAHVIYNASTHQYVMWYIWIPHGAPWGGQYGVATSSTPTGPFVIQNSNVQVAYPANANEFDGDEN